MTPLRVSVSVESTTLMAALAARVTSPWIVLEPLTLTMALPVELSVKSLVRVMLAPERSSSLSTVTGPKPRAPLALTARVPAETMVPPL